MKFLSFLQPTIEIPTASVTEATPAAETVTTSASVPWSSSKHYASGVLGPSSCVRTVADRAIHKHKQHERRRYAATCNRYALYVRSCRIIESKSRHFLFFCSDNISGLSEVSWVLSTVNGSHFTPVRTHKARLLPRHRFDLHSLLMMISPMDAAHVLCSSRTRGIGASRCMNVDSWDARD